MAQLTRQPEDRVLLSDLTVAASFMSRLKGLLGTKGLAEEQGMWIHACNSVHTFFMAYPIDCVFLDSKMRVKSLVEDVRPGKVVWPQWGATSVIEMKSGRIKSLGLRVGDQLNVGS
ncbi:MAG: DUF192 domain-containing protein [Bdellovibrionaceae bacterium]|nr:DUF192 domain-containing protein [Pseudobdellovibrionaceae bacterium]